MVSTQLHLGQREPDEIHMHWQTLMKEVYGDGIWEPRQLLHSKEFAVYGDGIWEQRQLLHSNESAVYGDSIWDLRHIVHL